MMKHFMGMSGVITVDQVWRTDSVFTGNWADPNWSADGTSPYSVPDADKEMIVNSGTATVYPDVSATAAGSLSIARDAEDGTVVIAPLGILSVTGEVTVGDGGTLKVDGGLLSVGGLDVAVGGVLELRDASKIVSPAAAVADNDVTITVGGTLRAGDGIAWVGNIVTDLSDTNLTLAENAFFEWSFTKKTVDNDLWFGDTTGVSGTVDLGNNVTIQLVDGGGASGAGGVDVLLFGTKTGATIDGAAWDPNDLAKINILPPGGLVWTWDALELRGDVTDGYRLVLTNLVTPAGDFNDVAAGNWTNDDTWSDTGIPDQFSQVTVNGFTVTVNTTGATAGNLDIDTAAGKVEITGGGTLVVTGGINVAAGGTLALAHSAGLAANSLTLNGGVLKANGDAIIAPTVTLGAGGGTFDAVGGMTMTVNSIDGTSLITKTGDGTLDFTGLTSNTGTLPNGLAIEAGTVVTGPSQLALPGDAITINDGATLSAAGAVSRSITRNATGGPLAAIAATGDLLIGDFTSGVDFTGVIMVNSNTVALIDPDTANVTQAYLTDGGRLTSTSRIAMPAGDPDDYTGGYVWVIDDVELGGEIIFGDSAGGATQLYGIGPDADKVTITQDRRGNIQARFITLEVLGLDDSGFSPAVETFAGSTFLMNTPKQFELHGKEKFKPDAQHKVTRTSGSSNGHFTTLMAGGLEGELVQPPSGPPIWIAGEGGFIRFDADSAKFEIVLGNGWHDDDNDWHGPHYQPVSGDAFRILDTAVGTDFSGEFASDGEFIVVNQKTGEGVIGGLDDKNFSFPDLDDGDLSWAFEVVPGVGGYVEISVTPEPGTMALLAIGAIGMLMKRRRRRS